MIINFEKLRNHSPEQSSNIVCLTSHMYEKEEHVRRQKLYGKGFHILYDDNIFDVNGAYCTIAKIRF